MIGVFTTTAEFRFKNRISRVILLVLPLKSSSILEPEFRTRKILIPSLMGLFTPLGVNFIFFGLFDSILGLCEFIFICWSQVWASMSQIMESGSRFLDLWESFQVLNSGSRIAYQ